MGRNVGLGLPRGLVANQKARGSGESTVREKVVLLVLVMELSGGRY